MSKYGIMSENGYLKNCGSTIQQQPKKCLTFYITIYNADTGNMIFLTVYHRYEYTIYTYNSEIEMVNVLKMYF